MKKIFLIMIMMLICSACSISNKPWKYSAETKQIKQPTFNATIQIPSFQDSRISENNIRKGGALFAAILPLVPYTEITDLNVPEGILPKAPEIFAKATGEEIVNAFLFDDVIIMPSSQKMKADYLLEGTILSTNVKQTISFYGLSLPGDLLWLLGAPLGKAYNTLEVKFRLFDKKMKLVFEKIYKREKDWFLSYYSREGLSKYEELYKDMNKELLEDLKKNIKR